ncbi:MAG: hypothetical protein DI568_12040 [Sphingomonas sp.]|nr:MAG: hypothetical protein DI568_12040 [Sphingomonas sp.]
MPLFASRPAPEWRLPEGVRRRAPGIIAVTLIHILLGWLLLTLAPNTLKKKILDMAMITVNIPDAKPAAEPAPKPAQKAAPAPAQPRPTPQPPAQLQPPTPPAPPVPEMPPEPTPAPPQPTPTPPRPAAPMGPPKPAYGPPDLRSRGNDMFADTPRVEGSGPNGEPLYAAAWVREPYHDELAGYLSTAIGPGWGLIACRTAPGNRVEDCIVLGESPPGSRIAKAVQAAAWQFLVRPPRIGGKPQVGEWVRIRIDYTDKPDGRAR